jgi:hypothetical protein
MWKVLCCENLMVKKKDRKEANLRTKIVVNKQVNAISTWPRFVGRASHRPLGLSGYSKIGRPAFGLDKPERTKGGIEVNQILDMIIT